MSILLLQDLLQMPVAPAGGVGKLGCALLDQQLPLRPGVVLLREYPLELAEYLVLLPGHALPALLEPVDRIALESRDDGLEAAEVLEYPQLLGYVDPGLDRACPLLGLGGGAVAAAADLVGQQDRRDDAQRDGVELVDGGEDSGGVVAARALGPAGPDGPEALVGDELAEDLGVHASELLGEVTMGHLGEGVRGPGVVERVVAAVQAAIVVDRAGVIWGVRVFWVRFVGW